MVQNSPANYAGLQKGDFLVSFEEDLVLFMSCQDIEAKLKTIKSLNLHLKIERGYVEPMVNPVDLEPKLKPTKILQPEEVVTIVLDKDRGIYKIWIKIFLSFSFFINLSYLSCMCLMNEGKKVPVESQSPYKIRLYIG